MKIQKKNPSILYPLATKCACPRFFVKEIGNETKKCSQISLLGRIQKANEDANNVCNPLGRSIKNISSHIIGVSK